MGQALAKSNNKQNSVRILDDIVVNQIAAGEVVERPASVVKELVENSIDAGSRHITVAIEEGGRRKIEVLDDGCGMDKADALLALERFGTSKIVNATDLLSISTLGFRGEALPSIASVSKFRLLTAAEQGLGTDILIEGGQKQHIESRNLAKGTRIEVSELFYNLPARKRFLRSERTEEGLIRAQFLDLAAAHPEVRFTLLCDGREVLQIAPERGFFERLKQLKLAGSDPLLVETATRPASGLIGVRAMLSKPIDAVTTSTRLRLIVNGRTVRDRLLLRAVRDGYGFFLKPGKYPSGTLALELSAEDVDVNVHPQKAEVRFRTPDAVFMSVKSAVQRALSRLKPEESIGSVAESRYNYQTNQQPEVKFYPGDQTNLSFEPQRHGTQRHEPQRGLETFGAQTRNFEQAPAASASEQGGSAALEEFSSWRFVGQVLNVFLILEKGEQLAVVDMHAAHERIVFYRLKKQYLNGDIVAQVLLVPEVFSIPQERIDEFEKVIPLLMRMGMECEVFGRDEGIVRSLPAVLGNADAGKIVREIIDSCYGSDLAAALQNKFDDVLSRVACHGSIRSGRELEREEAYALLDELGETYSAGLCPHGRPVSRVISRYELELMFGRA